MRHIICLLLENEPGALSRVAGLFSARGYNIESLSVAPTEEPSVSRMTITTTGSEAILEQITKQLNKLVDVVKLLELTEGAHVERAMMLIKVRATGAGREEVKRLADIFRGRIVDVTNSTYIIEVTGTDDKLDALREQYAAEGRHEEKRVREESADRRERMLADAAFRVSQEEKTARDQLSREALEAALSAAEDLIHKSLSQADHDRIAAEYLDEIGPALKATAVGDGGAS